MGSVRVVLLMLVVCGVSMLAQGRGGGAPPPLDLPADSARVTALKKEAIAEVDRLKDFSQQMVDQIAASWDYFNTVQTRSQKYEPLIRPEDTPALDLNRDIMAKYREQMRKFYFDPAKYKTYLEQLGITYPTVRK